MPKGLLTVLRKGATGEYNDHYILVDLLYLFGYFQSVFTRQLNIHEDNIRAPVLYLAQRFLSVAGFFDIQQRKVRDQNIREGLSETGIALNK
jgi:hypothetical protein